MVVHRFTSLTHFFLKGLFNKAIIESNPLGLPLRDNSDASEYGAKLASKINCTRDDLACMRSVSAEVNTCACLCNNRLVCLRSR